ncbi:MAG: hypothetical protein A3F54_02700 [Candidatus Kerfeldbacteria bacterium RIFCSPHIGHO2_12_FULL_48_17]|uniref:Uncharacterized protein n=1 Tax=Candidatus Kerfeldbacteria bacterium RIFCSPHIGHO2_12_FULL_48_17 TaxID=1798542 RepID=A0A1G2B914_9BACT|nr:MAG: hypothetical protein A3F54_02700 [Candidatus Kerfeldbacteria bacterium RIFCSPHIGHO2_12_FULL_48_17]
MTAQTPWKNSAGVPFEPEPPKPEPRKPYPKTLADWMDERLKERIDMREQEKRKMNPSAVPVPEPSAPQELRMGPKDRVEWERNIMRKGYGLAQGDLPEPGDSPPAIPYQQKLRWMEEGILDPMLIRRETDIAREMSENPWQMLAAPGYTRYS